MNRFEIILEAFAAGDALGMPTEFMTYRQIKRKFGFVSELIDPKYSMIHSKGLKLGEVTDDTEQVLYLIEEYHKSKNFSEETVKRALLRWFKECKPDEKGYIGPSTKKSIEYFDKGIEVEANGTTSGAPMRVLAPVLYHMDKDESSLITSIINCVIPTHNTNLAIESSLAVGFAYYYASKGANTNEIIDAAIKGAKIGERLTEKEFVGPSIAERLKIIKQYIPEADEVDKFLQKIYYIFGTTMEAVDVAGAAIAIGTYCKDDVWLAIRMGASIGGDTDTIAAIAGALSAFQANNHNIPKDIIHLIQNENNISFKKYAKILEEVDKFD